MNYDIVMLQKTKESPECGHGNSNTRNTQVITFFRKVIDNIIGSNACPRYIMYIGNYSFQKLFGLALQIAIFRGQQGRISRPVKAILSGRL